jgi:hypothetical protein
MMSISVAAGSQGEACGAVSGTCGCWSDALAAGVGQSGAGGQHGAVGVVEGEGAAGSGGDEVAAVVDEHVVAFAQAYQVVQTGAAAVAPVLDVV